MTLPPSSETSTTATTTTTATNNNESTLTLPTLQVLPPHHSHNNNKKLGTAAFATLVFYSVSGGPFGVEATIRNGGALFALLGFLIFPWIWSIPEAMITTELSSTFPHAAGGVVWVQEALGDFGGWMVGYLGWISGTTDNALYPVLFLDYLNQVWRDEESKMSPTERFLLLAAISIGLGGINYLGLNVVGNMAVLLAVVAMSPFVILSVVGAFQIDPSRWLLLPVTNTTVGADEIAPEAGQESFSAAMSTVMWRPFLNNIFWNLNSFDSAGSFAADVEDPTTTFPRGMTLATIMVVCGYFVPMLISLGALQTQQEDWVDGYFATVASNIVGKWLGDWTVFAAGISNLGLFQASLSSESFQLMGMAERDYVPHIFAKRSQYGTPTYAIGLGISIVVVLGANDFSTLIEMLNFNYAIALLLEYVAFLKLRRDQPNLNRPWRIPLGTRGCLLMLIPTIVFTVITMSVATYWTLGFSVVVNIVGVLLYKARKSGLWKTSYGAVAVEGEEGVELGDVADAESNMDGFESNGGDIPTIPPLT